MLDSSAGRGLLLAAALLASPGAQAPIYKWAPSRLVWNGAPDDVSLVGCKNNSSPRLWG